MADYPEGLALDQEQVVLVVCSTQVSIGIELAPLLISLCDFASL